MTARGGGKRLAGSGAGGFAVTLTGDREIDRRLGQLEKKVQKRVLTQAMRRAMHPVRKQASINARKAFNSQTKATVRGIKVRATKRSRSRFGVDVRIGKGAYVGRQFYASFLEWDTAKRKGTPFIGPAYASHGKAARSSAMRDIRDGVEHQARLLGKG